MQKAFPKTFTVNSDQLLVLDVLFEKDCGGDYCFNFDFLSDETGLDRKAVRRACRALARKGLTECVHGLFNDDGQVCGSGYRTTPAGRKFKKTPLTF